MNTISGIDVADIVAALRATVVEAKVRVRELEAERATLRDTYNRKDNEIRQEIQGIESQNKVAKDALKALAPPKSAEEMRAEVESAVYELLLNMSSTTDREAPVSRIVENLTDLSWEYEGRGFEGRVRGALKEMEVRGLVKGRQVELKNKPGQHATLWSVKNKKRKFSNG